MRNSKFCLGMCTIIITMATAGIFNQSAKAEESTQLPAAGVAVIMDEGSAFEEVEEEAEAIVEEYLINNEEKTSDVAQVENVNVTLFQIDEVTSEAHIVEKVAEDSQVSAQQDDVAENVAENELTTETETVNDIEFEDTVGGAAVIEEASELPKEDATELPIEQLTAVADNDTSNQVELSLNVAAEGTKQENADAAELAVTSPVEIMQPEEQLTEEEEYFSNLVIADVNDYVNVRDDNNTESEVVGKLYDNSVGELLEEKDGWFKIKSGNVEGYVSADYCVTGDDAINLAKEVGTRIAKVNTTTLRVRNEANTESETLGLVPEGEELIVDEELDGWVKVSIEEGDGYVSTEFVELRTDFVHAESKAEEEARLEAERQAKEAARQAAKKAAQKRAEAAQAQQAAQAATEGTAAAAAPTVTGDSDMGNAVAQYGLQFVGNPYVYGGSSLTEGTDCSGFVMSVYDNFGVSLPHSSTADRSQGYAVDGLENAQPGDIVCYSGHVAIYIGNGQIVHASTASTGIKVSNADYKSILAIRRIF